MKWLQGLGLLKEPAVETTEPSAPSSVDPEVPTPEEPAAMIAPAVSPENGNPAGLIDATTEAPPADAPGLPPGAIPPVDLTPVMTSLGELNVQQRELRQFFENRLRSDELQGKALERLHDELQQYKTNFVRQSLTPLLKEVIFCHDFVIQQAEKLNQPHPETTSDGAQRALDAVRQMLVDLLFKFDVEPYRNEAGTGGAFEPRTQQCLKTLPTDQPDLDKKVAQQGACGFRAGEMILRRELVTVYKYSGEARPPAEADNNRSTP